MENYVLIPWPESQEFMDEVWFEDEAILADVVLGYSSYFIPEYRIICNEYIEQRVKELLSCYLFKKQKEMYVLDNTQCNIIWETVININETA